MRSRSRWDVEDSEWITSLRTTVEDGHGFDWWIEHTGGLEDIDIRFVEVDHDEHRLRRQKLEAAEPSLIVR